ncbi:hypothetical protein ARALYDRAFT_359025 [Arabidopsis lyrata subsp. lyrata]|uniref:Translation elongation factor EFTu-like domain-containing protein n=1 Tax=Arabidopsis lyrata subsp. lyrata TaxID=81972 RepID=D7MVD2_ARALL|nr:hypothetical protein ARALYDRAFT_359025 [Arabidopsis lyrata subsp. lyrata]
MTRKLSSFCFLTHGLAGISCEREHGSSRRYFLSPLSSISFYFVDVMHQSFSSEVTAKMYASKFGVDEKKMMERLWGENFFDPVTKKWTTKPTGSATCKRGFIQFCYEPIKQIISTCMNDEKDKLWPMLTKLGVQMKSDEKELMAKPMMKRVMQTWLPASTTLLEMMIFHLPSPSTGPLHRSIALTICMRGRFFAFGRVFSGKVATGMKVRIMGPNFVPGEKKDLYVKSVQRTVIWMGKKHETVEDVPCGNTVAMVGLDQFITKNATLMNEKEVEAHPIRAMRFSVSPVVRVAVQCKVALVCFLFETGKFLVSPKQQLPILRRGKQHSTGLYKKEKHNIVSQFTAEKDMKHERATKNNGKCLLAWKHLCSLAEKIQKMLLGLYQNHKRSGSIS